SRLANGRRAAARSATQGECSATSPNVATKASRLSVFTCSTVTEKSAIALPLLAQPSLMPQQPRAKLVAIGLRHAVLVAERHRIAEDGLGQHSVLVPEQLVERAEDDA